MAKLYNLAKVGTSTTGTGTLTLGLAALGYQTFGAAGAVTGDVISYKLEDANGAWEIGTGTYNSTGPTLTRTLVQSSTGSLINLSGSASVYITPLAADIVSNGGNNTLGVANGGTGVNTSTGSGSNVLNNSPTLINPALGTPASGNLANCTFPTLNQNTTGSSASCTGNAASASYVWGTNLGKTGAQGFMSTTSWTSTDWSNVPIGGSGMTITGTPGQPVTNYGFFMKFGNRDAGGGWGGMWMDYSAGDCYYGNTVLSTNNATWYKLAKADGTNASGSWPIAVTGTSYNITQFPLDQSVTTAAGPTFNTVYTSNWFRSSGNSGWYNQTYAVGIYSQQAGLVETYGGASFKVNGNHTVTGYDRTNGRRFNNISFASKCGHNSLPILWNGKLYTTCGNAGSWNNATTGRGTNNTSPFYGANRFKVVGFPQESSDPIQVGGFVHSFAFALFANGNLYTWGNNNIGQLGLGDTTARGVPTLSATGVTQVFTHGTQAAYNVDGQRLFIKKSDGYIYGCGYNGYGALGLGDTTNRTAWTQITALGTNVINVFPCGASWGFTFVQKSDHSIWAAGKNDNGACGNGSTLQLNSFVDVTSWWGGGSGYVLKKVSAGCGFRDSADNGTGWAAMLLDNGTTTVLRTAGNNSWGTIGNSTAVNGTNYSTPQTPSVGTGRIADIAGNGGGPGAMMCLKEDGTLYAWGHNGYGQLGNGTTTSTATPFVTATGVAQIFCDGHDKSGYNYYQQSFHRRNDGRLYACGFNDNGYCGIGNATSPITAWTQVKLPYDAVVIDMFMFATTGGGGINVALTNDGRMFYWGYNGQNGISAENGVACWCPVQIDLIHG